MHPTLATDYGNFYAFLIGAPAMLLAFITGVVALALRIRSLAIVSGVACFAIAAWFLFSLKEAKSADLVFTLVVVAIAGIAGLVFVAWKRVPH